MDIERARDLLLGRRQEFLEHREDMIGAPQIGEAQQDADGSASGADRVATDSATQTSERAKGEFGPCEVCGRDVEESRLTARLDARRCHQHREESERADGR